MCSGSARFFLRVAGRAILMGWSYASTGASLFEGIDRPVDQTSTISVSRLASSPGRR
jgi:hypothetical protein